MGLLKKCKICNEDFESVGRKTICDKDHFIYCKECNKQMAYVRRKKFCSQSCASKFQGKQKLKKECIECSKTFIGTQNSGFCSNPHERNCIICGKAFYKKMPSKVFTCSKKCAQVKRNNTNIERYGVDNVSKTEHVKNKISEIKNSLSEDEKNEILNKMKKTFNDKYGVDFPLQNKEILAKSRKTLKDRYDEDNPAKIEVFKEKAKKTNNEKYGVDYSVQSEEVKEKIKETNLKRYGVENAMQNPKIREKANKTNLERYGVENVGSSKIIKERIKNTVQEKYGVDYSFQSEEVKEKIKETNLKRYGVENAMQNQEIKDKVSRTVLKRYGEDNIMKTDIGKKKIEESFCSRYGVSNFSEISVTNYNDFKNFKKFLEKNRMTVKEIAKYFNINEYSVRRKLRYEKADDLVIGRYKNSVLEEVFAEHFKSMNIDFIRNDRSVLSGKELDFLFPEHKLAVEISPTSSHNAKINPWGGEPKKASYHKNKFIEAEKNGIELITIFDWHPWPKMIEMIENKLNTSKRIPARKTKYFEKDKNPEVRKLASEWHILGLAQNLSVQEYSWLEYNNEIILIGLWSDTKEPGVKELKRLVTKPGYSVIGGVSKLESNFFKNHNDVKKIITFSDCDFGTGNVYSKLGYKQTVEGKPNLYFYNEKFKKVIKYLSLTIQGADRLLKNIPNYQSVGIGDDLPSNKEIVESYGFLPIYDCGYRKWEKVIN